MPAPPLNRRSPGQQSRASSTRPSAYSDHTANGAVRAAVAIGSIDLIRSSRTRTRVEVCDVLGLEYWAEHPERGHVWATGTDRRFHVVALPTKRSPIPAHVADVCCADVCTPFNDSERSKTA